MKLADEKFNKLMTSRTAKVVKLTGVYMLSAARDIEERWRIAVFDERDRRVRTGS